MSSGNDVVQFTLMLTAGPETDPRDLAERAIQLREELQRGPTEYIDVVHGVVPPPSGTKVVDPITFGAFMLGVSVAALPKVIELIQHWLLRQQEQTLRARIGEVELEIPRDASKVEIARLIDAIRTLKRQDDS
jgi:hypothetical protein